ncbi:hypothetical protein QBC35DRAFT_430143 [Podospora australis]|uniref:Telomeric single stranded DNA binding POT1/Cdc13 domain-containing protein n=1 Tax=Podospora australis TaxID=1536484 RepID=A0AAN6WWM3_9PEZI|nr:hypothetical protein QBC35DRAFT_430143 [Podospora australis]
MASVDENSSTSALSASNLVTPIAQLDPDLSDQPSRIVRGEVGITWPYNSVTKTLAFLVAEPDVRLRRAKGQVRIELHGPAAKAVSECGIGAGDQLLLSLEGVEWAKDTSPGRIPGSRVDWQLQFTQKLVLELKSDETNLTKYLNIDHPVPEPEPEVTVESPAEHRFVTPELEDEPEDIPNIRRFFEIASNEFASPALVKRARISYGSLFEDGMDIFDEDGGVKGKGRKRTRFGRNSGAWRYTSQSPSPEPSTPVHDAMEEDDADMSAPQPSSPKQMMDEGCQTMDTDIELPGSVPVDNQNLESHWQDAAPTEDKTTAIAQESSHFDGHKESEQKSDAESAPRLEEQEVPATRQTPSDAQHDDHEPHGVPEPHVDSQHIQQKSADENRPTEEHFLSQPSQEISLGTSQSVHEPESGTTKACTSSLFGISNTTTTPFTLFGTSEPPRVESPAGIADQVRFGFSHIPDHGALSTSQEHQEHDRDVANAHFNNREEQYPASYLEDPSSLDQQTRVKIYPNATHDQDAMDIHSHDALTYPPMIQSFGNGQWEISTQSPSYNPIEGGHFGADALNEGTPLTPGSHSLHETHISVGEVPQGLASYGQPTLPAEAVSAEATEAAPRESSTGEVSEDGGSSEGDEIAVDDEEDEDSEEDEEAFGEHIEEGDYDQRNYNEPEDDDEGLSEQDEEVELEAEERYGNGELYGDDEEGSWDEDEEGYDEEEGSDADRSDDDESEEEEEDEDAGPYQPQYLRRPHHPPPPPVKKEPIVISLLSDSDDDDQPAPAPKNLPPSQPRSLPPSWPPPLPPCGPTESSPAHQVTIEPAPQQPEPTPQKQSDAHDVSQGPTVLDPRLVEDVSHHENTTEKTEVTPNTIYGQTHVVDFAMQKNNGPYPQDQNDEEIERARAQEIDSDGGRESFLPSVEGTDEDTAASESESEQETTLQHDAVEAEHDDIDEASSGVVEITDEDSEEDADGESDYEHYEEMEIEEATEEARTPPQSEITTDQRSPTNSTLDNNLTLSSQVEMLEDGKMVADQHLPDHPADGKDLPVASEVEMIVDDEAAAADTDEEMGEGTAASETHDIDIVDATHSAIGTDTDEEMGEEGISPEPQDTVLDTQPAAAPEAIEIEDDEDDVDMLDVGSSAAETPSNPEAAERPAGTLDGITELSSTVVITEVTSGGVTILEEVVTESVHTIKPIQSKEPRATEEFTEAKEENDTAESVQSEVEDGQEEGIDDSIERYRCPPTMASVDEVKKLGIVYKEASDEEASETQEVDEEDSDKDVIHNQTQYAGSPDLSFDADNSEVEEVAPDSGVPTQPLSDAGVEDVSLPGSHIDEPRSPLQESNTPQNNDETELTVGTPSVQASQQTSDAGTPSPDTSVKLARQAAAGRRAKKLNPPEPTRVSPRLTRRRSGSLATTASQEEDSSVALARNAMASPSKDTSVSLAKGAAASPSKLQSSIEADTSTTALKSDLIKRLRTELSECVNLKSLRLHNEKFPNVVAIVTTQPRPAARAKGGPREYFQSFHITDPSVAPTTVVEVQLYRPHKESLPVVKVGDAILLQRFQVKSISKKGFGLRSQGESAWAVFDTDDGAPQIKGAPVEDWENHKGYMTTLRAWWRSLDASARSKIEKADKKLQDV